MAVEDGFPVLKAEKWMGGLRNSWKEGAAEPPAHVLQERDRQRPGLLQGIGDLVGLNSK